MTDWLFLLSPWLALTCLIIWDVCKPSAQPKEEAGNPSADLISPDFQALITTIRREGIAYRKEEQREDRGKKFREWITIGLVAVTFVAICYQVNEMIKVYEPIKEQAIASTKQAVASEKAADATARAADASTKAAVAATRQSENSDKALVQSQRAWIGPRNARSDGVPEAAKEFTAYVEYQNSGREPGIEFTFDTDMFVFSNEDDQAGKTHVRAIDFIDACKLKWTPLNTQVVFPSTGGFGAAAYTLTKHLNGDDIGEEVVSGVKSIMMAGCFDYKTVGTIHRSAFCFFYNAKVTKPANWNFCPFGNDAD